jgi:hypothetical protein
MKGWTVMFSEMVANLNRRVMPEPVSLARRFDIAITKKLGVVKLPPQFWMRDPKINPRSDHLFWAALLILDSERIELALSVIAVEIAETSCSTGSEYQNLTVEKGRDLLAQLLHQIPAPDIREEFEDKLQKVLPGWLIDKNEVRVPQHPISR